MSTQHIGPSATSRETGRHCSSGWGCCSLPAFLLVGVALRHPGPDNLLPWLAVGFQVVVCTLTFLSQRGRLQPLGPAVMTLYLVGLAWIWCCNGGNDWFTNFAKAVLLVVPLGVFAFQMLIDSGAPAIRRARLLADRLAARKDWPSDLTACRTLPEVKSARAALSIDATPALALLEKPPTGSPSGRIGRTRVPQRLATWTSRTSAANRAASRTAGRSRRRHMCSGQYRPSSLSRSRGPILARSILGGSSSCDGFAVVGY